MRWQELVRIEGVQRPRVDRVDAGETQMKDANVGEAESPEVERLFEFVFCRRNNRDCPREGN